MNIPPFSYYFPPGRADTPGVILRDFQIACDEDVAHGPVVTCPGSALLPEPREHSIRMPQPMCNSIPCSEHPFQKIAGDKDYGTPQDVDNGLRMANPYNANNLCYRCRALEKAGHPSFEEYISERFEGTYSVHAHRKRINDSRRANTYAGEKQEWLARFETNARLVWAKWQLYIEGRGPQYFWEKERFEIFSSDPLPRLIQKDWDNFRDQKPLPGPPVNYRGD